MMPHTASAVIVAFAIGFVAINRLKVLSHRLGWLDRPGDPLKIHAKPIPLSGGVGVALGTIAGIGVAALASLPLGSLAALMIPAIVVAAFGLWDDIHGLRPSARLAAEVAAAVMAAAGGVASGLIVGGSDASMALLVGLLALVFATVGGVNALNMQDGMDGLAGSLALISSVGIARAADHAGAPLLVMLGMAQAGALGAFLCFNLPPASVFLGDSGSYFLGFLISAAAVLLAMGHGTPTGYAAAALIIGLPVIDAAVAIVRRVVRRQSPFRGDRDHLYDQLLGRGVTPRRTLAIATAIQLMLVSAGVFLLGTR